MPPQPGYGGPRWVFGACDTGRKPYDLLVAAVLLRARLRLPDVFHLASDGAWNTEWTHGAGTGLPRELRGAGARRLLAAVFGPMPDDNQLHSTARRSGEV